MIAQYVRDWYFEQEVAKTVGCLYLFDNTCHNLESLWVITYPLALMASSSFIPWLSHVKLGTFVCGDGYGITWLSEGRE